MYTSNFFFNSINFCQKKSVAHLSNFPLIWRFYSFKHLFLSYTDHLWLTTTTNHRILSLYYCMIKPNKFISFIFIYNSCISKLTCYLKITEILSHFKFKPKLLLSNPDSHCRGCSGILRSDIWLQPRNRIELKITNRSFQESLFSHFVLFTLLSLITWSHEHMVTPSRLAWLCKGYK